MLAALYAFPIIAGPHRQTANASMTPSSIGAIHLQCYPKNQHSSLSSPSTHTLLVANFARRLSWDTWHIVNCCLTKYELVVLQCHRLPRWCACHDVGCHPVTRRLEATMASTSETAFLNLKSKAPIRQIFQCQEWWLSTCEIHPHIRLVT